MHRCRSFQSISHSVSSGIPSVLDCTALEISHILGSNPQICGFLGHSAALITVGSDGLGRLQILANQSLK